MKIDKGILISRHHTALWAAGWMAERILHVTQVHFRTETEYYLFADKVRQLARELKEHEGDQMRELKDRLVLGYPAQVEFIRYRDIALDCEMRIRQLQTHTELLQRQKDEALAEIERLMAECIK